MPFTLPSALVPGDTVAVVAPSSPFSVDELWRGLAWVRTRYRVRIVAGILGRDGYLAGDDTRRRLELEDAMFAHDVKAIVAARGGYGSMRIAGKLPWDTFARSPKWLVGFSDITALHACAWAASVASIHGPNVTGLGRAASPAERASWLAALERPRAPRVWRGLRALHAGRIRESRGTLVGGNLSILHAMAAAGRLSVPEGAVLALEDVTEAPYRVDRMLTSLALGGYLARAGAIVFGSFERCGPGRDGRTVESVLAERTATLGVPVLSGAPFGHGTPNEAFVLGVTALVRDTEVFLSTEDP